MAERRITKRSIIFHTIFLVSEFCYTQTRLCDRLYVVGDCLLNFLTVLCPLVRLPKVYSSAKVGLDGSSLVDTNKCRRDD